MSTTKERTVASQHGRHTMPCRGVQQRTEIDDKHALEAVHVHGIGGADSDVIEHTEAFPSVCKGMVRAPCSRTQKLLRLLVYLLGEHPTKLTLTISCIFG
jgi:hypothetical protein